MGGGVGGGMVGEISGVVSVDGRRVDGRWFSYREECRGKW